MQQVKQLKSKINSLQNSLLMMSYGDQDDRPILYANIKQSLEKAKRTLLTLQLMALESSDE